MELSDLVHVAEYAYTVAGDLKWADPGCRKLFGVRELCCLETWDYRNRINTQENSKAVYSSNPQWWIRPGSLDSRV